MKSDRRHRAVEEEVATLSEEKGQLQQELRRRSDAARDDMRAYLTLCEQEAAAAMQRLGTEAEELRAAILQAEQDAAAVTAKAIAAVHSPHRRVHSAELSRMLSEKRRICEDLTSQLEFARRDTTGRRARLRSMGEQLATLSALNSAVGTREAAGAQAELDGLRSELQRGAPTHRTPSLLAVLTISQLSDPWMLLWRSSPSCASRFPKLPRPAREARLALG